MPDDSIGSSAWNWNTDTTNNFGINCKTDQLKDGSCSMNMYEILWNVNSENQDLQSFVQDLFWWVTMFIGFIVFIAITYSGFLMITWWADEKQFDTWKKWIIYSLIWLFLVGWAYGIIKFIQLIAKW